MTKYYLPIEYSDWSADNANGIVDMSDLRFDCDEKYKIRAAFLFFRNTITSMIPSFDDCSYEMKEKYLLFYLFGDIDQYFDPLSITWLEILLHNQVTKCRAGSILTYDEVTKFIDRNRDKVNEVLRFIISIPLYMMDVHAAASREGGYDYIDMSGIEITHYCELNIFNLSNMTLYPDFLLIYNPMVNDITPVYYIEYFASEDFRYYDETMKAISSRLPFMEMLCLLLGSDDQREAFIKSLSEIGKEKNGGGE